MDEERARSADEDRDADAAEPDDLAALRTAEQALDASADEVEAESPPESEGLADWLERVRRSAPGLLVGAPSMRAAAPPRVPESEPREETPPAQPPEAMTLSESSEPPADDASSVDAVAAAEEPPITVASAALIPETPATSHVVETSTFAPTESRLTDAVEGPEAPTTAEPRPRSAVPAEVEQREPQPSVIEAQALPTESPLDHGPPPRDASPIAAGHSTAMATDDITSDRSAPAEAPRWLEATNERRIGDLAPPEYHLPLDFESRGAQVVAPQPQAVVPLAPAGAWPHNVPSPSAGAPALVVSEPSQRTTQPPESSPRAEWVSPWPTLPDSFAADDEIADPATALRARDRWTRLVREQESA